MRIVTAIASGGALLPEWPVWVLIVLCVILLMFSFLFSGTETAFFSLQKLEQQRLLNSGRTGKRLFHLLNKKSALITTILIGNETVNVTLGATGAELFRIPGRPALSSLLNILIITPLLVLFSEITPKVLAFRFNQQWVTLIAWPLSAFFYLVAIPRFAVQGVVGLLARAFGVHGPTTYSELGEEELLTLIDQGTLAGTVDSREREMIENVLDFDELTVGRVMTPRPDMFIVPLNLGWTGLVGRTRDTGFSRIPVYGKSPDDILGVMLLKDMLRHQVNPPTGPRQLRSLLLRPKFVPQSKPATDMLREFLADRSHIAFAVDEHGTLVGLVTLDDLIEELFGDVKDDDSEEPDEIVKHDTNTYLLNAGMDIEDFEEETSLELPEGDYHTVGGFIFHQLGRLPDRGDTITWEGHEFVVKTMDGRRIAKLSLVIAPQVPLTEEANS